MIKIKNRNTGATLLTVDGDNLREANLREANLQGANLQGANLREANLREADLREANLREANLRWANLQGANLQGANLQGANLQWADLRWANLQGANLQGANLRWADLQGADLPNFSIVPETGGFYAWKKTTNGVIKVYIPASARRVNSLTSRKCRASHVKVISGPGCGGNPPTRTECFITYNKGATIKADKFDDDIRLDCTNGIHFFMTEREAREW